MLLRKVTKISIILQIINNSPFYRTKIIQSGNQQNHSLDCMASTKPTLNSVVRAIVYCLFACLFACLSVFLSVCQDIMKRASKENGLAATTREEKK